METREDWRNGCYYNRHLDDYLDYHFTLKEVIEIIHQVTTSPIINYNYVMIYNEFLV
jgi:hypothetical protein